APPLVDGSANADDQRRSVRRPRRRGEAANAERRQAQGGQAGDVQDSAPAGDAQSGAAPAPLPELPTVPPVQGDSSDGSGGGRLLGSSSIEPPDPPTFEVPAAQPWAAGLHSTPAAAPIGPVVPELVPVEAALEPVAETAAG
ncbi:MAG: hypothetical protein ACRDLA_17830, partial [Thermoleophilaceae bacterium]